MKKVFITISVVLSLFQSSVSLARVSSARVSGARVSSARVSGAAIINHLTRIEVAPGALASQILFEFSQPLYYEKKEVPVGDTGARDTGVDEVMKLYFPGMRLSEFQRLGVLEKIRALPVVQKVSISFETVPLPRVVVTISFIKGKVFLKLTKMEEPNFLVLDIFDKNAFKAIARHPTTIRTTLNSKATTQSGKLFASLQLLKKKEYCRHARHTLL